MPFSHYFIPSCAQAYYGMGNLRRALDFQQRELAIAEQTSSTAAAVCPFCPPVPHPAVCVSLGLWCCAAVKVWDCRCCRAAGLRATGRGGCAAAQRLQGSMKAVGGAVTGGWKRGWGV